MVAGRVSCPVDRFVMRRQEMRSDHSPSSILLLASIEREKVEGPIITKAVFRSLLYITAQDRMIGLLEDTGGSASVSPVAGYVAELMDESRYVMLFLCVPIAAL